MDIKAYGQVLSFALFATGPFGLLLDGDQHFILCLLHIKHILEAKTGRYVRYLLIQDPWAWVGIDLTDLTSA